MADYFFKVGKPGTATTLSSPGYTTGDTSITVGSTANWPTTTKVAFAIDRAEIIAGEEVQIAGTYTEWTGQVTGATTIGSMVLSSDSPNSDQNYSAGSLTRVYIPVSATRENKLVEGILQHANQDGTLITQAVRDALSLGTGSATGWEVGSLPNVSAITYNGNRSYTITHASSVATIISEGMRRRFTRTTAANTYMGGLFNGSSHYFTKTSPSGTLGTVTNNITLETNYQLDAYPAARKYLGGRADSTPNNGFGVAIEPTGQVLYAIFNGGTGNSRTVTTYQSLPLNKKTHIAVSHTGATILIYLDGIAVPTATATAGTAPTTAGTGGDFSIGRFGAWNNAYITGYASNFAVFDAVLSAATIRDHATRKLTGAETNCIGAWSLDNTAVNQQAPGTNDLTATGGVGYTNISPFGNNGVSSTLEYALTMSVSSDGLTEVVQCPEGCALPAFTAPDPSSKKIDSSAYSVMASPFGFVSDKGRWKISSIHKTSDTTTSNATYGSFVGGGWTLTVPTGGWSVGYQMDLYNTSTTIVYFSLSSTALTGMTTTAAAAISPYVSRALSPSAAAYTYKTYTKHYEKLSTSTNFVMYTLGATTNAGSDGATTPGEIFAEPAGL